MGIFQIRDEQEWCDINNVNVMNKEPSIIALLHIYGRFVHKHEARLDVKDKEFREQADIDNGIYRRLDRLDDLKISARLDALEKFASEPARIIECSEPGITPRKYANMFDSVEKLEDAYAHLYRAYHAKHKAWTEAEDKLAARDARIAEYNMATKDLQRVYYSLKNDHEEYQEGTNALLAERDARIEELEDALRVIKGIKND